MKLIIASLYGNPIGQHHLDYLEAASALGDKLICVVNNDTQVRLKNSIPFQSCSERLRIIQALKCVNIAWRSQDRDLTICETLKTIWELNHNKYHIIFTNGGNVADCSEREICEKLGIELVFGVGGTTKTGASSQLIENAAKEWIKRNDEKTN